MKKILSKFPLALWMASITFNFILADCNKANAVLMPRPIGNESRIKIINYMPNVVIRFVGHYMYHSIIEFAPDEEIKTITMGTPTAWQLYPEGNRIFLKPINQDATTNMTVITSKRMYFFEMHAKQATSISDSNLVFMMKFMYPDSAGGTIVNPPQYYSMPDLSNPDSYNFNYKISGKSLEIEPLLIFDDGEFTYFKFRNINTELPAVFLVDGYGNESLINYRMSDGYMIVERVSNKFTLRHGKDVICVFNEDYDFNKGQNKDSKL